MSPHVKHAFTPEELAQIDNVYKAVWAVMISNSMYAGWQRQETLQLALRKRIVAFACHGVSDPGKLADVTLRTSACDSFVMSSNSEHSRKEKEHLDRLLDEALDETFPASDPPAALSPTSVRKHPSCRPRPQRKPEPGN